MILAALPLLASGCDWRPSAQQSASVTVQLPPARPYKPAAAKPAFSEPLLRAAKS